MEWLTALKDYVPLFQTCLWVLVVVLVFFLFGKELRKLLRGVQDRVERGSSVEVEGFGGGFKLGQDLRNLEYVEPADDGGSKPDDLENPIINSWTQERGKIQQHNRDFYLVHILTPSDEPRQRFDIYMYLVKQQRHAPDLTQDLNEVQQAEFFLGKYWGNQVLQVMNDGGIIGLATSAYGPFLAICRVLFADGTSVILHRYIDFEMGRALETKAGTDTRP